MEKPLKKAIVCVSLVAFGLVSGGLEAQEPARGSVSAVELSTEAMPAKENPAPFDFALGKLKLGEGDYAGALEALERAVEAAPEEPYVHLVLAETNLRIGRMEPALRHADRSAELAPQDVDVLNGAARVLVSFGDRDEVAADRGEQLFGQILELQPENLETLHILGSLHQRRGDLAGAETFFGKIAQLQPGPRSAAVLLQLLMDQGKRDEAIELLIEVLEHSPDELEMRITLADLLVEAGDHASAAQVLSEVPGGVGDNSELARRIAVELYRSGDPEAALSALEMVLVTNPDPRLRLFHALLLSEAGRSEEALVKLTALHQEVLDDPEISLSLARMLNQSGRSGEASIVLNETLSAMGDNAGGERVRMELAQLFIADGNWALALEQAETVANTTDEALRRAAALIQVDALIELERPVDAEAVLARLGEEGPLSSDLLAKQAEILFRLGEDEDAESLLDGIDPPDHAVEVYQRLGRFEQSIPLLTSMVEENPESLQARFWLGAAYERTGRPLEAEDQFKELIRRYPDFHLGLNYLGYLYAQRGENLEEALDLLHRAVGLSPGNGAYIDSLGWVYYKLGDYELALTHLKRAVILEPGDGTVFDHLGDTYLALGDRQRAREAYRRALELEGLDDRALVESKLVEVEDGTRRVEQ